MLAQQLIGHSRILGQYMNRIDQTARNHCHTRLTALYTTRLREEEEALLQKADRTDLIRFCCGHHPHLRRWQHMTGMSETDSCRLCAEEEESSEHLWLRCPAFIAERQRLGLGRTFDELVRLPCASLALLRIIFRRLR